MGQLAKSKNATGKITRFETQSRAVWTTGDATVAYQAAQKDKARVQRVTRDLVFIDQRYAVLRDRVVLATPGKLSWLLHAEDNIAWEAADSVATIRGPAGKATLTAALVAPETAWTFAITKRFPVPVDPKYVKGDAGAGYVTGTWHEQAHLTLESTAPAKDFTIYTVLWPERGTKSATAHATLGADGALTIARPDGKTDRVALSDNALDLR